jgi:hypothetical protein
LLHSGSRVRMCMVHLPAVNTPQFEWCKTTMDRRPMPVPPIYQPEVAAKSIVVAALNGRRSKVLGSWNKLLVVAGQLSPALANQFAARGAWEAQLTDQPVQPDRPANLRRPVDAENDFGAHGAFDAQAGGFLDRHYLRTIPKTARTFAAAAAATIREKARRT